VVKIQLPKIFAIILCQQLMQKINQFNLGGNVFILVYRKWCNSSFNYKLQCA